ncbi:hypothetical protein PANO111632_17045 [Paracoccus nototheniae]|uniref:Translation initiation factor 2 n=1 Tax=Paracoccus nototheniae TaxID=2489002 RepID=A0ABW4DWI4_9RHOB|nr:hypothetical protein [Paracoccus nototheniae]
MIRTISIGSYISIQGLFEGSSTNGNILVRVGDRTFEGKPIGN